MEFETGMGAVPEALDMAVRLMTPEEVALVTSSSQYAYKGRSDRPPVRCTVLQGCSALTSHALYAKIKPRSKVDFGNASWQA